MPANLIYFYAFWTQNYAFWTGNYAVSNFCQHRYGRSKCLKTAQNQKTLGGRKKCKFPKKAIISEKAKIQHHLEDLGIPIGNKNSRLKLYLPNTPKINSTNAKQKQHRLFKINPRDEPTLYPMYTLDPPPEITSATAPVRDVWHDCRTYISWEFHWSLEKKGG